MSGRRIRGLRWWIIFLVLGGTALNYLTRPALILMAVFPNRDAILIGERPQVFAGKQPDASQRFSPR